MKAKEKKKSSHFFGLLLDSIHWSRTMSFAIIEKNKKIKIRDIRMTIVYSFCDIFTKFCLFSSDIFRNIMKSCTPACICAFTAMKGLPSSDIHFLWGGRTESSRPYLCRKVSWTYLRVSRCSAGGRMKGVYEFRVQSLEFRVDSRSSLFQWFCHSGFIPESSREDIFRPPSIWAYAEIVSLSSIFHFSL